MRSFCALLASLLVSGLSFASPVTYNYVGNDYVSITNQTAPAGTTFNTSQYISGSLSFAAPLADMALGQVTPASFSFSNGVHTFTSADSLALSKILLEVVGGVITQWDIQFNDQFLYANDPIGKQENVLNTSSIGGSAFDSGSLLQIVTPTAYSLDAGSNTNAAGRWSVAATVPEPGSLALVALALLGAAVVRRRD